MAEQEVPKDWFEFMQKMWNPASFPMPGMITPTVNLEEIEKKIFELKAVENWLTMSTGLRANDDQDAAAAEVSARKPTGGGRRRREIDESGTAEKEVSR
jgi:hypothetical protein